MHSWFTTSRILAGAVRSIHIPKTVRVSCEVANAVRATDNPYFNPSLPRIARIAPQTNGPVRRV